MLFLNISLDSLCLIFVPKYCPIKAGTIKKRLTNKSFIVPRPWYNNEPYKGIDPMKYIVAIVLIKNSLDKLTDIKYVSIGGP